MNRHADFQRFRNAHKTFTYHRVNLEHGDGILDLSFEFEIDGAIRFRPSLRFTEPREGWRIDPLGALARRMGFYVGMVELVSYWKACCPAHVDVVADSLGEEEIAWWKHRYFLGLGEFFYTNEIATSAHDFMRLSARSGEIPTPVSVPSAGGYLIPVGGGKDSIVSLELLRPFQAESKVLLLSAPRAARQSAELAGYGADQIVEVKRTLDPALLAMNREGALNGHTPFSALLAFVSLFAAALTGAQSIVLSNESSANEPTVHGTEVNHQYSKSFQFEQDFRDYVGRFITPDIQYYSLLRPLNELQIASLMSTHDRYFSVFRSCNEGSRDGRWCGHCPKCLFVFLMLQPFCSISTMMGIFGRDLLDDGSLAETLWQLLGLSETKPFDCVGTVAEVRATVSLILHHSHLESDSRELLSLIHSEHSEILISKEAASAALREWNPAHHVPPALERRLRESSLFQ